MDEKKTCASCRKLLPGAVHVQRQQAVFATQAPTSQNPAPVRCPHCGATSYAPHPESSWWCACQICQCSTSCMTNDKNLPPQHEGVSHPGRKPIYLVVQWDLKLRKWVFPLVSTNRGMNLRMWANLDNAEKFIESHKLKDEQLRSLGKEVSSEYRILTVHLPLPFEESPEKPEG